MTLKKKEDIDLEIIDIAKALIINDIFNAC